MNMMKETKINSLPVVGTLYTTMVAMILTQILLLLHFKTIESAKNTTTLPGCPESCGGIPIPFPFGISENCYVSKNGSYTCKKPDGRNCFLEGFDVTCYTFEDDGSSIPVLNASMSKGVGDILNISLSLGQVRVDSLIDGQCYNSTTKKEEPYWNPNAWDFVNIAPFRINTEKNKFTVTGCNTLAYLIVKDHPLNYSVGCFSSCNSLDTVIKHGSCSGIGCCQTDIPKGASSFLFSFDKSFDNSEVYKFSPCSFAMVVEGPQFKFNITNFVDDGGIPANELAMVLDWAIGNTSCEEAQTTKSSYACKSDHSICLTVNDHGYLCNCSNGYEGNPYLHGGCQDIDECAIQNPCSKLGKCHNFEGSYRCSCPLGWRSNHTNPRECNLNVALVIGTGAGIVTLLILGVGIYVILERRNISKIKEKYFRQHGGWVLLENIKSNQGFGFTIFTKQQIEHATNNFDSAKILAHGGNGTVYGGSLKDQAVAIKKCKIVDESKKKEFGKEMLILSQISHKNIVKLLGCCLEVEVPMLVYEFIPNGTLYHYIHYKKQGSHISFATRLRIAHESAEALAYLHTSASPPIYHGDVKSSNILLDQNYMAKVSDFGASILAPTDEAQFVTLVQGTCGYLDPEYMQSCKLTDKSDVYSFGVVLLELLTSKPVIDFNESEEVKSLSSRFLFAMQENKMQELLDDEIKHEDDMELICAVAELAKECLRMKGEERPTMKEVAEELHRINNIKKHHPWGQEYNPEETETLLGEQSHHDREIEHTVYYFNIDKEAEESIAVGR
ncbi:wall-associated receptor kinase 3-like [Carex rostrata]